jgi:DNA helicase HerA-like ATPase
MNTLEPILVAKADSELYLLPHMANRHGLIAGATGTGKTVTLQVLAEGFSRLGVPVFAADVKGDLSGLSQPGTMSPRLQERLNHLKLDNHAFAGSPTMFWDVFGERGHPVRTTVSDLGPLLLSRLLQLNEVQAGVLNLIFRIADENGLLLLDIKDLRAMLQHIGSNPSAFTNQYGNISTASLGAIQRNLLALEQQGADRFFGEPALNLDDFLQCDSAGRGFINLLAADKLMQAPKVYATVLLWLLSEIYERFPEVGDQPKPKLVFFFDEAHLLFNDVPSVLLERIEQVIRLVRSKGVGVFFITQNPRDIPDNVLGQLGNRVQHALRAFTPRDQKAVQAAAETFRPNPRLDTTAVLTEMGLGEALVSLLDEKGQPRIVERAFIVPPQGQIGAVTPEQRQQTVKDSLVFGTYETAIDRESAYERLKTAMAAAATPAPENKPSILETIMGSGTGAGGRARAGRPTDSLVTAMSKSVVRSMGSSIGREIVRGVLGSIFGGRRR